MKKNYVLCSLIVMSILFITGLVMLFSSTAAGQSEGSRAMRENGGSMDTQKYYLVIETTVENYRTGGMVISMVGGFGILLSGYALYKEI